MESLITGQMFAHCSEIEGGDTECEVSIHSNAIYDETGRIIGISGESHYNIGYQHGQKDTANYLLNVIKNQK